MPAPAAGVDVELPAARCYGAGPLDEEFVDRAALRVLTHKCELGLLDPDRAPPGTRAGRDVVQRALAQILVAS
ncbi:hypothetical protein ABT150_45030 [Streptomyces mirabilis]|uniref:hypothetical protein n=1 Tax=Streptomyces mirabilis TaxID=68239 RepID=UPI00332D9E6F